MMYAITMLAFALAVFGYGISQSGTLRSHVPPDLSVLSSQSIAIVRDATASLYAAARGKASQLIRDQLHRAIDESVK